MERVNNLQVGDKLMTDPFDVQLPAQMRLPPVDMSGMKEVGRNVASWFQGNPELEMRSARLGLEFEQVRSQIATQQMDNRVKQHMLQEKTQADLWTAEMLAVNRYDPSAIMKYVPPPERSANPGFARSVMNLKNQASITLARDARKGQEIGFNDELTNLIRAGDEESAIASGALFSDVHANGWTDSNMKSLATIRGELNTRLAVANSRARIGVDPREVKLREAAMAYRDSGDTTSADLMDKALDEIVRNKSPVARTIHIQVGTPGTPDAYTESMTPEEFKNRPISDADVVKKLGEYSDLKAKIDSGKGRGASVTHWSNDTNTLATIKSQLKAVGIDADTRKRIVPESPLTNAPAASAPASAPFTNEVSRVTATGRTAIFDASTKKFIRYGD